MTTIDLPVYLSNPRCHPAGVGAQVVVSAEIVDVAPHLASIATFAVHEAINPGEAYTVTNVETGMRVAGSETSPQIACAMAAILLDRKSVQAMVVHLAAARCMHQREHPGWPL